MKLAEILEQYNISMGPVLPAQIPTQPPYYRQFERDILRKIKNGKDIEYDKLSYNEKIKVDNLVSHKLLTQDHKLTSVGYAQLDQMETVTAPLASAPFSNAFFQ